MYLPSLAGLSLTGPSHCRPCATDKVVQYKDEDALREEGGKHLAEFPDEPGGPPEPGCAICQLPFEPGRKGEDGEVLRDGEKVIILSCGHAFHLDCMTNWGKEQSKNNRPVKCPLCNKPPNVTEMHELGLGVHPMKILFRMYLDGDENGWIQLWETEPKSIRRLAYYHTSGYTMDGRSYPGMTYIQLMVEAWARVTRANALAMSARQKILKRAFTDERSLVPGMDLSRPRLRWDEKKLVSLFARRDDDVFHERQPSEVQCEGWQAISTRADADSEFKDVFGLVYKEIGMVWDDSKTIKYNLFACNVLHLRYLFALRHTYGWSYDSHLQRLYPQAMSYGFTDLYDLAVDFAKELKTAPKVDFEKFQKLIMLLDKFGGDRVPNALSFRKLENGSFEEETYSIDDQVIEEKDYLENIASVFKLNLDNGGVEWDESINYDDALTNEKKWKSLNDILVFDHKDVYGITRIRTSTDPDIYRGELRRFRDVLVTKYRQAREHLESVGGPKQ